MMCVFCRHDETKVIDTRMSDSFVIRRRRECLKCRRRFTTHERVEESSMKVIKKDGSRVPYDREKLRRGLEKACYKRPISAEQIDELVRDVESDVNDNFQARSPLPLHRRESLQPPASVGSRRFREVRIGLSRVPRRPRFHAASRQYPSRAEEVSR